jgi:hypothetical protein
MAAAHRMFVGVPSQYTGYSSLVLNAYVLIIVFYEISLKYFFFNMPVIKQYLLWDQAVMTSIIL